jgi:BolA family transcriptional regulator, general stress-responsive regulator
MALMKEQMARKLRDAFSPDFLEVVDESHQHHGHSGSREGGETHFRVEMITSAFTGKSRIDRHRMVNAALSQELTASVHALALGLRAPGEKSGRE